MKKSNIVICLLLVVLICLGWSSVITNLLEENSQYDVYLENASVYREKGLYQKAFASYENALALRESKEIRDCWLEAYRMAYEDEVISASKYAEAMLNACELYPDCVEYWERLISFYLDQGSYNSAYDICQKCAKAEVESERLTELSNRVLYSYTSTRKVYSEFVRSSYGRFAVHSETGWGVLNFSGEETVGSDYIYISSHNSSGQVVYVTDKGVRLKSINGVVEAIMTDTITKAGAYGSGLLPVYTEGEGWRYLDCESGEYITQYFDEASNYQNGLALVKKGDSWYFIDPNGDKASDVTFDDVKLHGNGDYAYKNVMIAASNGKYAICDENGKTIKTLDCLDADIYLGSYIAFQDASGLWGFVDKNGTTVIEPVFENAKSFSGGLAAVCDGTAWGFINPSGALVIENKFLTADYFTSGGVCFVSLAPDQYYLIKLRFVEE